LPARA